MNTHADKTTESKSQAVANDAPKLQTKDQSDFQVEDNGPEGANQRELREAINNSPRVQQLKAYQDMANNSPQVKQLRAYQAMANSYTSQTAQRKKLEEEEALQGKFEPVQKKENKTGLPENLKSGVENLSGHSLDDVKVHYNSDKPAQVQAHAYAQGTDIHMAPGQEKHLPHEAWHVVQQKQGRVKPTLQMKENVNINDDAGLEMEADVMGEKALQLASDDRKSPVQIKEPGHSAWHVQHTKSESTRPGLQLKSAVIQKHARASNTNTAGTVMQLKPGDLAKAQFQQILQLPHNLFFDPWKSVKNKFGQYANLLNMPVDPRRDMLYKMRARLEKWEKAKMPNLAKAGNNTKTIAAAIPYLKRYVEDEFTEVADIQDQFDGGHSHVRHGADLTDQQLQNRLVTQKDRLGKAAKANTSSRFDKHDDLVNTRVQAVNLLNAAKTATLTDFGMPLTNYLKAWQDWFALPVGALGPAKGAAKKQITAAWALVSAKEVAIGNNSPDRLPVKLNKIPNNALAGNVKQLTEDAVETYNRYLLVKNHGKKLGTAYDAGGLAAKQPDATMTILQPGVGPLLKAQPAAGWALITHFPQPAGGVAGVDISK